MCSLNQMKCTRKKQKSVGPLKNYCTHNKSKKHPQANDRLTDIYLNILFQFLTAFFEINCLNINIQVLVQHSSIWISFIKIYCGNFLLFAAMNS